MRRLGCLTESVRYFVRPCSPTMKYQMPMGPSDVFDTPSAIDGSGLASLETAQGLSFASRTDHQRLLRHIPITKSFSQLDSWFDLVFSRLLSSLLTSKYSQNCQQALDRTSRCQLHAPRVQLFCPRTSPDMSGWFFQKPRR